MRSAGANDSRQPLTVIEQISWLIVALTTISLPLILSPSVKDSFRVPKELFLRASGIALFALAICEWIFDGGVRKKRPPRSLIIVLGTMLLWSVVITLTSTNRTLSVLSLVNLIVAAMFFLATYRGAQDRSLKVLYFALVPALVNALIAIAQATGVWTPIPLEIAYGQRLSTTALLGNPDDVGMFLMAPAVAAAALAVVSKRHRWPAIFLALIFTAGIIASETMGAVIAVGVGIFLLAFKMRPWPAVVGGTLCVLIGLTAVRFSPQRWSILRSDMVSAAHGDIDPFLSGRVPAFLAAWRMFRQHPVIGVGPGCFPFQYFDEKIAVEKEHPWLLNRSVANFGEAHNEHLQCLAEGGLPAYIVFIAALVVLSMITFRAAPSHVSETSAFARAMALSLAASVFTLALSSFPFHVAAATTNILFLTAVTTAWGNDARD